MIHFTFCRVKYPIRNWLIAICLIVCVSRVSGQSISLSYASGIKACAGASFKVRYSSTANFIAGNVFTVVMSDKNGSFTMPVTVATVSSIVKTDSILITLPANAEASTYYYLRISSSSPVASGSSSNTFTIGIPTSAGTALQGSSLCTGNTIKLSTTGSSINNYVWSGPNGFTSNAYSPSIPNATTANNGVYSVRMVYLGGCTGPASNVTVTINANPAPPTPQVTTNSPVCTGDTLKLSSEPYAGVSYVWRTGGATISASQNVKIPNVSTSTSTSYTLQTILGSCRSDLVEFSVVIKYTPVITDALVNGNIDLACPNTPITLSTSDITATLYEWKGPDNFTGVGRILTIPASSLASEGVYSVRATKNGCTSGYFNTVYLGIESTQPATSQSPDWEWGKLIPSQKTGASSLGNMVRDEKGNLFIAGGFSGTYIKLSATDSLSSVGAGGDVFLAKYDSSGNYKWGIVVGSAGTDYSGGLALDKKGYIYMSGMFSGVSGKFGSLTVPRIGANQNLFLTKIDKNGNPVWVKQASATSFNADNYHHPIRVDKAGNCFLATGYQGTLNVGSYSFSGPSAYISKYDSNGTLKWAKRIINSVGSYSSYGMELDAEANCYLTGDFGWDISVAKFDSSGNSVWLKNYTQLRPGGNLNSFSSDVSSRIVMGKDGDFYLTGGYYKIARTPGTTIINPERYLVVMKIDAQGSVKWFKYINEYVGTWDIMDIGVDKMDNVYVAAKMSGPFSCSFVQSGSTYVAMFSNAGQLMWVKPISGANSSQLAVSPTGSVYLACHIGNTEVDFGNGVKLKGVNTTNLALLGLGKINHEFSFPPATLCAGADLSIPFTVNKNYNNDNIFKLQLSDANGSFTNPVVIASSATTSSGTLSGKVPYSTASGTKYRLRIISTSPALTGTNNGSDIIIARPTITTGAVTGSPYCVSSTIKVPYAVSANCPYYPGNIFNVQLSDQYGVFNNPVVIGSLVSTSSDTITAILPSHLPYGTAYKVRVVSTLPEIIGTANSNALTIYGRPFIISESSSYCEGTNMNLSARSYPGAVLQWTGPNGFAFTGSSTAINGITSVHEGTYKVTGTVGSCVTPVSELTIAVYQPALLDSTSWKWAKGIGGSNTSLVKHPAAIVHSANGYVYTFGFNANATDVIEGITVQAGVVITKSDTSGKILWAKTIASSTFSHPAELTSESMILDEDDNIYVNGYFRDNLKVGTQTLKSYGAKDVYFCKVDSSGNPIWAYQIGGAETYTNYDSDNCGSIELDSQGNPVFVGYYLTGSLGKGYFSSSNGTSVINHTSNLSAGFIVSYSGDGELLKVKTFEKITSANLSLDASGNVYLLGAFTGSAMLDDYLLEGSSYPSAGVSDVFLAKFNSSFSLLWAKNLGSPIREYTRDLKADRNGSVYVATAAGLGTYTYLPSTDNGLGFTIGNAGDKNLLSRFDEDGNLIWARPLNYTNIADLKLDGKGNPYVSTMSSSGSGSAGVNVGCDIKISSNYNPASYIIKFDRDGEVQFIKDANSTNQSNFGVHFPCFEVSYTGDIYVFGEYIATANFDHITLTDNYGNFLAKLGQREILPVAHFSYSKDNCVGASVQFKDLSATNTGSITSWKWTFGDASSGLNNSSILSSPSHEFAGEGSYSIKLVVENSSGKKDSVEKTVVISRKPILSIDVANSLLCSDAEVKFKATSTNYIADELSLKWDFGDHTTIQKSPEVAHTFSNAGSYKVRLIGQAGHCVDSTYQLIAVNPSPSAAFALADICAGPNSSLVNTSTGSNTNWNWKIWDGSAEVQSFSETPATVLSSGTYLVSLVVEETNGCKDTLSKTIEVLDVPSKPVIFKDADSLKTNFNYAAYKWYLDGNLLTTETSRKIVPVTSGLYSVEVRNSKGCVNASEPYLFSTLGISTGHKSSVALYPNPFDKNITLTLSSKEPVQVKVINALGIPVKEITIEGSIQNDYTINTSDLVSGFYEVMIVENDTHYIFKVIKY